MYKFLTSFLFFLAFVQVSNAQFLWYENESNTYKIEQESTSSGTFLRDVPNPNTTGINTNTTVSKFNREEGTSAFLQFDLYNVVTDFSGYAVTFKAYIDIPTAALTANNSKISVHLSHPTVSSESAIELNFTVGQQWETFTFKEVKLYPNPVSETLTLNRMTSEVNYITVFNTIETKVLEKVWHNGSTTTQLDMRSLDSGIYFVKLSNSNHYSITRKIYSI